MRKLCVVFAVVVAMCALGGVAVLAQESGPYKVLKTAKVGGDGGWDYVYADEADRQLYIPRSGQVGRITVFNLDTLAPEGEIPNVNAHGVAVDPKTHHGFASSKPVVMFDTKTLKVIKTIDVEGNPDGIHFDPYNERVWVLSHSAPNATVINAVDGSIVGTVDLGGAPEQGVTDGKGHLYIDIESQDEIAVVDANTLKVTGDYSLAGKGGGPGGLSFDVKNHILFSACHNPAVMVILNSEDGKIITSLPIGTGTDGATFNPATKEAFSSQGDGTLTVIKENSPTSFEVEQNLQTMQGARTLTLDTKTNHILVISAEYEPPPAQPAGQAQGQEQGRGRGRGYMRRAMVPGSFTILVVGK